MDIPNTVPWSGQNLVEPQGITCDFYFFVIFLIGTKRSNSMLQHVTSRDRQMSSN